jgi:Ca2+-transporting ATPase
LRTSSLPGILVRFLQRRIHSKYARFCCSFQSHLKEVKPISPWAIFFAQFKSVVIWILIGACVVSGMLGEVIDAFAILAIVVLNAVVGFYQEFNAEKSIAALQIMTAPRAKVWRDGAVTSIAAADVVPGDILELESGDLVAADARLLIAEAAEIGLGHSDIVAPFEEIVVSRNIEMRQTVAAGMEPPLFLIATGLGLMRVDAAVSEKDIGAVKPGDKATFTVESLLRRGDQHSANAADDPGCRDL